MSNGDAPNRPKRERTLWPESVRMQSIDWKLVVSVLVIAAGGLVSFTVLQEQGKAQGVAISEVGGEVEDVERRVDDLEDEVEDNTEAIAAQGAGLNWIGSAVEAIAREQGVRLPPRPIVPE